METVEPVPPCPFCGKAVNLDDDDTLYPTGSYWRDDAEIGMRTYHPARRRLETDGACWGMHCPTTAGGCGAEIHGDSKEEVLAAWSRRTPASAPTMPQAAATAAYGQAAQVCRDLQGEGHSEVWIAAAQRAEALIRALLPAGADALEDICLTVAEEVRLAICAAQKKSGDAYLSLGELQAAVQRVLEQKRLLVPESKE